MSWPVLLAVAVAGGLGAACRYLLDSAIDTRDGFPLGTVVINVSGSFALGLLTGLVTALTLPVLWQAVVGVGFLGGYTTFSASSLETVRLLRERRKGLAALNALGSLTVATAAAAGGLALGLLA